MTEYHIGDRINSWELVSEPYLLKIGRQNVTHVLVKCECGFEKEVKLTNLTNNRSKSCGSCKTRFKVPKDTFLIPTGNIRTDRTSTNNTVLMWEFNCICGDVVWRPKNRYLNSGVNSCGCKTGQLISNNRRENPKHGFSKTKEYVEWLTFKKEIGISEISSEWNESPEKFCEWVKNKPDMYSIYRYDTSKNYSEQNCYWGPRTRPDSWTKEETQILLDNYKDKTCKEISKLINRTTKAVQHKFAELKLVRESQIPSSVKIGERYNRLTIQETPYPVKCGKAGKCKWKIKCLCDCGNLMDTWLSSIMNGSASSCGCYLSENSRDRAIIRNTKYSSKELIHHPLYSTWLRINADTDDIWSNYENFYNDMINLYDEEKTITKIDCDLVYSNSNYKFEVLKRGTSISEIEMRDWLNKFGFNFKSDWQILKPKQIDMYDENLKIGIEYCGLNWHHENSKSPRTRKYHWNKYNSCKQKGIRLITIFSDEWSLRTRQVKNFLKSVLNIYDKRIFARKCEFKIIGEIEASNFIEDNHIQGKRQNSKHFYGLYNLEELVGVMSFGVHHRNNVDLVLDRMCFKSGYQIIGGASKLLNNSIKELRLLGYSKIISWSDNRWSYGNVYEKLGFVLEKELGPDYSYVEISQPYKRKSKQSMKKSKTGCPEDKLEREWCLENGYSRIWDCGKNRYTLEIQKETSSLAS